MSRLKKFLIVFLSFFPLSVAAFWPAIFAGLAAVAGFSVWRSVAPVDVKDALQFFSSCWTCQMFSGVMSSISNILPSLYSEIGRTTIMIAITLTIVYFVWSIVSQFFNLKLESGWSMASRFGTHLVKLGVVAALLVAPLPRMISEVIIEPVFNIGLSINHVMADGEKFAECMVATTLMDEAVTSNSIRINNRQIGAFPVKLRSGLACELASVHQLTGLGITVGWTMLNMAFDYEYMHKIMWSIPLLPNIPMLFAGFLVLAMFFMALLPIPLYFLEIFVGLALDFIMLPLMLLAWLFKDWKIISSLDNGKNIQGMIDDVVKGAVGIAMTIVFLIFAVKFLDVIIGQTGGVSRIAEAVASGDSKFILDGLMMRNDSFITMVILGAFFMMFMTSIPALIKTIFNIQLSDRFYNNAKKDFNTTRTFLKKWWKTLNK